MPSTRSASRAAARSERTRDAEAVATGPLGALSHDELGVIFDGLANPLQPAVGAALSSTCKGLRTSLWAALELLKKQQTQVKKLCHKTHPRPMSCAELLDAERLSWSSKHLTTNNLATLGKMLPNWLPSLERVELAMNGIGDAGIDALCDGLGRGALPSLRLLGLGGNCFGPQGAEALAAALRRGAMPKLEMLGLQGNPIGSQGVAALTTPLRKLPALRFLRIGMCDIGDEGMASLFADDGKDDFKALEMLEIGFNGITDVGLAALLSAINRGAVPHLVELEAVTWNEATEEAVEEVFAAIERREDGADPRASTAI